MAIPGEEAVVVLTNDSSHDVSTRLLLPVDVLGIPADRLTIVDAATNGILDCEGGAVDVRVRADHTAGGGYRLLHIVQADLAQ